MSSPTFELENAVMRAGAGAGKTTELTTRVLELAKTYRHKNDRNPHFVVTTFTRKATQELKERLLKKAMAETDVPWLVDFVKSNSQLHISTIHGVLSLYLARYGSVMNLSPQIKLISSYRSSHQLKQMIRSFCETDENFSSAFQALLETAEFFDLIDAFQHYFALKMQFGDLKVYGEQDFAKSISKAKASLETLMNELASELKGGETPKAWLALGEYLETQISLFKSTKDFKQWALSFDENVPATRKGKDTPESWPDLKKQIQEGVEFFIGWNSQASYFSAHKEMTERFQYCAEKLTRSLLEKKLMTGEISMSDLETLSLKLAREHPEAATAFSKQWDYWLIDEYQDTSPAQVELLRTLMGTSKSFVVGDPQQSIYLFRGARSEVFLQRERECKNRGGALLSKRINYRSQPATLEFFNHVFTGLGSQFQPMEPNPEKDKIPSSVAAEILVVPEPEKGSKEDPELSAILYRCQELLASGVSAENIAVLSRNNLDLERLAWMAKDFGIPVQVHSSGKFFERREIVDALSVLKFLCNPHDNKNLIQLLRSPGFYLEDQVLADWCRLPGKFFWKSFSQIKHPLMDLLKSALDRTNAAGIGQVWMELLFEKNLFGFAQFMDPSGRREANLWKLVQMLRIEERRPGFSFLGFLKELELQASTEETDQGDAVPVLLPSRINLMTVHASKGLEFEHVILARVGDPPPSPKTEFFHADENSGRWSLSPMEPESGTKKASLASLELQEILKARLKEEDERVFYVALTRAKRGVSLIIPEKLGKNSWVPRLGLNLQAGLYQEKAFAYRVRAESFIPVKADASIRTELPIVKPYEHKETKSLNVLSVTEILESAQNPLPIVKPLDGSTAKDRKPNVADIQRALTGVQVHKLLENLKYHALRDPKFDWKKNLTAISNQEQKALRYVLKDREGLWQKLILTGEVEFGFSVLLKNNLIQGQIDLWGIDGKTAWIVDYKTGNPKYQDKAFAQLKIYAWALKQMGKIPEGMNIELAVIYPISETTKAESFPSAFAPVI